MRPWQDAVAELVSTGLTQQQLTLLVEITANVTRDVTVTSPSSQTTGAKRTAKWRKSLKTKQNSDVALAVTVTSPNVTPVTTAPLSILTPSTSLSVVTEESLLPTLVEGQKVKRARGARLPDGWEPSAADFKFATSRGLRLIEIDLEATKFRNYWMNRTDRQASKPRWDLAWQNWILNVKGSANGHAKTSLSDLASELANEARELERQAGIGRPDDPFGRH